jgi:hypothetical protein
LIVSAFGIKAGEKRSSPEDSRKGRGLISKHDNEGAVKKYGLNVSKKSLYKKCF